MQQAKMQFPGLVLLRQLRYTTNFFTLVRKRLYTILVEHNHIKDTDTQALLKTELRCILWKYERELYALITQYYTRRHELYIQNFVWEFLWSEIRERIEYDQECYEELQFFEKWFRKMFNPRAEPLVSVTLSQRGFSDLDYIDYLRQRLPVPFTKYETRLSACVTLLSAKKMSPYFSNLIWEFLWPELQSLAWDEKRTLKEIRQYLLVMELWLPATLDTRLEPRPEPPPREPQLTRLGRIKAFLSNKISNYTVYKIIKRKWQQFEAKKHP